MYCKKCGKRLADGDKFCGNCGTKIDVSEINIGFAEEEPKPKKNFDFGAFNWDLDGYPDEDKAKTEDVDFNWNTVLEEKKRKDIEEKSFTETIMTENELFDRIQSEDNAKDASEISFNWELGSTTRVEKADRFESIIPKVEEKAELEIPVEVSEEHEEVKDLVDIDEALAAGLAAASSPRKSIDKFYTFNQKNEEFQALLDQEYERLRNRIREDSEAEAIIANKEEKLEQARATWSKEALEEPVEEAEETVEVAEETEAPVEAAVEAEVEVAEAEAVNDTEETEESQVTEVETEEAPETEEAAVASEFEVEEAEETEEAEEVVQEAEEPAIQEEACACETEEEVACDISSEDSEEACVVEAQAQVEEVAKAEEAETEDEHDDTEEAEAEETPSEPESGNPPSDEEKKEEETRGDEDSKETKLHYSDIFANDDVHDSDSGNEQKTGRWKIIVLDIIIVILAIAVICSGILVFAKGSAPANKISQGISWVTEKFSGSSDKSKDDKKSEEKAEKAKSMEDVVAEAKKNYVNIGKVQYDSKLKFDTSKDYGISELKNAKNFKNGEFSDGKLLSEAIVNLSLGYYSGLTDKVNSGSDDVLKLINEDSELYGHVKAIAEGNEEQQIKNIKIGEIKNSGSNYYVILQITEGKANSSDTSTETKILSIINKEKVLKVTAATDAE
ncbi:MAG: zinc ribbon domain-containing protein [[Eubacterium] sulci]|nr:zinc ribbon domain-containing protein [[Eubacterium] sulci]